MSSSKTITVAVIDDNVIVREALSGMLDELPDMEVVCTGAYDPAVLTAESPDVIVLDAGLADRDSLEFIAAIHQANPDAKIIVMDLLPSADDIAEFMDAGVLGFALKDASFDGFVGTIRAIAAGEKLPPPVVTESIFSQIAEEARGGERATVLEEIRMTESELRVLGIVGEMSNEEIAQRLDIPPHSVKSHVRNVIEKLALHARLQLADEEKDEADAAAR